MRDVGLASVTLAVCALATAVAAEPRRVAVVSATGIDVSAAVRDRGLAVVDSPSITDILDGWASRARASRETALGAVTKALARAQDLYLEQEFDDMVELLAAAERNHVLLLADPAHRELAWATEFRLGLALLAAKERATAAEHFALALALFPERRPAADLYGPDVAAAFGQAVAARERLAPRPVEIRTRPGGALVDIDGVRRLEGRATLRPGRHLVRLSAPGYLSRAAVITVGDDPPEVLALEVDPGRGWVDAWDAASLAPGREAVDTFWRARIDELGVDAVLWVGSARAAVITKARVIPARGASARAAAIAALDAWLGAPVAVTAEGGRSITREPLFWGGVAAVVALGIVGAVLLTSGDSGGDGGGITVGVVDP